MVVLYTMRWKSIEITIRSTEHKLITQYTRTHAHTHTHTHMYICIALFQEAEDNSMGHSIFCAYFTLSCAQLFLGSFAETVQQTEKVRFLSPSNDATYVESHLCKVR